MTLSNFAFRVSESIGFTVSGLSSVVRCLNKPERGDAQLTTDDRQRTFLHLSISPSTTSIDPIDATTSAIRRPSIILGRACKLANEGARTWQRNGLGEPSLTM